MSRGRRKQEAEHEEGPSAERWLLTYSDMITLLMVLFIVLFALGQTDIRKFDAFKDSFHQLTSEQTEMAPGGPGVLSQPSAIALILSNPFARLEVDSANSDGGTQANGLRAGGQAAHGNTQGTAGAGRAASTSTGHGADMSPAQEKSVLAKAAQEMEEALQSKDLGSDVTFSLDQQGLVVTILTDKVLFPLDSATLQPQGTEVIDTIAPVLATLPNQIDVEGDTDNTPIRGGPFKDNWALSTARAVAVLEELINNHGISPDRLQATGYGDTRPLVPNDTPAHRAENRRVEIVIFSTTAGQGAR